MTTQPAPKQNDEEWNDDKPLPEDAEIEAAHPTKSGNYKRYEEAMRLVGARHSKHGLCELVNWLLAKAERAERLREGLAKIASPLVGTDVYDLNRQRYKIAEQYLADQPSDEVKG